MDTKQIIIPFRTVGQATVYGDEDYGNEVYSCQDGDANCNVSTDTGTVAVTPNTGFMGMSQESAVFAIGGGLLLLVAVITVVSLVISKSRKSKKDVEVK